MLNRFTFVAASIVSIVPLMLAPETAHAQTASLAACGNINVRASAQCKVEASGGCTAQCTPVSFQAACAARLTADCDGQCTATLPECNGSCEGSCQGQCTDPGSFDCQASCEGSCSADCDAQCSGSASGNTASGSCKARCQANCGAKCSGSCSATPPTCEGKCKASCEGSCRGKATAQCQIECQGKLEGGCVAELEGGCKTRCTQPEGALFCDGQYVDTGNNLQNCIDALKARFNIQVQGSASGQCSGNQCTGEAEGSASCATSSRSAPVLPEIALLAMVGLAIARKSRRGRR
jgi:hypothetical protein